MKIEISTYQGYVCLKIDGLEYRCLLNSQAVAIERAAKLAQQLIDVDEIELKEKPRG